MPCYHPIPGYRAKSTNPSGKRSIVFNLSEGFKNFAVSVPCGRCIGCRLERARQWSIRCIHEASLYEANCFVTLTYDDDNLPLDGSLRPRDMVLFLKRLRKRFGPGIRFFQCGEYGDKSSGRIIMLFCSIMILLISVLCLIRLGLRGCILPVF